MNNPLNTLRKFASASGAAEGYIYSLKALKDSGFDTSRLPVSIKIVLESVLRNCDGKRASEDDVKKLAGWSASEPGDYEVPFVVSRIVLQDFTGVPLLVDLAAMRDAAKAQNKNPAVVEPLVPVDLLTPMKKIWNRSLNATRSATHSSSGGSRRLKRFRWFHLQRE